MSEKRRGLGRGIGALIPSAPTGQSGQTQTSARPMDVFFPSTSTSATSGDEASTNGSADQGGGDSKQTNRSASARGSARSLMEPGKPRSRTTKGASTRTKPAASRATTDRSDKNAKSVVTPASPVADTVAVPDDLPAPTEAEHTADQSDAVVSAGVAREADDTGATSAVDETRTRPGSSAAAPTGSAEGPDADAAAGDDGLVPVPGASFAELPVDEIVPNRRQPRQVFDEEDLDELAASIREVGVLQPIVVRRITGGGDGEPGYELIMGERRWRASQQAGNETVPAIIRDTGDGDLLRDALLENLHRANLNPLEEAAAYQQLLEDFGCTHDELATRIARSRPQISNTLRLMKLPPLVQRRVAAGVLSAGHARALLGLSDGAAMERLAQKIVAEGLSVRATEEIVALGDEPVAPEMRRRPRTGEHAEDLNRLATRLADRLDTRVKVNLGQRKGRIAIDFASVDDLNRILDVLAPGENHIGEREPVGASERQV
ncbi:ParB/RepB/Spo0J family partition protein [Georgenia subflava]|uniref:ParB/RepB/Spo0J family partition protein n=1 Tax=Georgenia subflava TaxID=1622177 RepID=A0A6N7EP61_9MICO|nr:ParB/RepB/Spo0J family partition protein [Georgenia subflava]MPV37936.1 ParB/RepB/Spo0J family partition protein [Georgenia subflava]